MAARHPLLLIPILVAAGLAVAGPALASSLPNPSEFREATAAPAVASPADGRWWRLFDDPRLDALIERGRREGVSLHEAAARVAQARAHLSAADATRLPRAGIEFAGSNSAGPLINAAGGAGGLIQASAHLSYEIDLLGRLSSSREAARSDLRAGQALLDQARLLSDADIARAYLSIRMVDEEISLITATADGARESLKIAEGRWAAGSESETSVDRGRAELGALESETLTLQRRRAELEHALGFLVGDPALAIAPDSAPIAPTPPAVPAGIPSEVLGRRPDIAAAQAGLNAAEQRARVARTAWLPNLTLTASGGYASVELADLLRASVRSFGVDLLMALPPFDGGRRKAGMAGAVADLDLATAIYRRQVLTAFRDVDDQLSTLRLTAEQSRVLARTVEADRRALDLATSRKSNGLASQLEVLDARRVELRDRRLAVQVTATRYLSTISLIQALGGRWGPSERLDAASSN